MSGGDGVDLLTSLRSGWLVQLATDDGAYNCRGIVVRVESKKRLLLRECAQIETGKMEAGVQVFREEEISELKVISRETEEEEERNGFFSYAAKQQPPPQPSHRSSKALIRDRFGDDHPHIKYLHSVRMKEELLAQKQISATPHMPVLESRPGKPRVMPVPTQVTEHAEGKLRQRMVDEMDLVRRALWTDPNSPPPLKCYPVNLYLIDEMDIVAAEALEELFQERTIGVSLECQGLGRRGYLSLVVVATATKVFIFDVVALGNEIFELGLRELLETDRILKVFHDVRLASDLLYRKHETELRNVSDTLATHSLYLARTLFRGYLPKYACSYNHLARCYFGISGSDLFFPHYRVDKQEEDSAIWLQRPLAEHLELGAARNVAYLLDLYAAVMEVALWGPTRKATEALLGYVRDADDMDAEIRCFESEELPWQFTKCLPKWQPDSYNASYHGVVEEENRQVHNFLSQDDPIVIFSRDCIHQTNAAAGSK